MPTAKIAAEVAMIPRLLTLNATAMPMIEQLIAPIVSDEIGANNDLINAARTSGGSSASVRWISSSFLRIIGPARLCRRLRS